MKSTGKLRRLIKTDSEAEEQCLPKKRRKLGRRPPDLDLDGPVVVSQDEESPRPAKDAKGPPKVRADGLKDGLPGPITAEAQQAAAQAPTPVQLKPVVTMPMSTEDVINNALVRELVDPCGESVPRDPALDLMQWVVECCVAGKSIESVLEQVKDMGLKMEQYRQVYELVSSIHDLVDEQRHTEAVDSYERLLHKMRRRGDLNSNEAMALLRYHNARRQEARSNRVKATATASDSENVESMISRLDVSKQEEDQKMLDKFKGTTPQGREIIRKQLYLLRKKMTEAGKLPAESAP